jgi:hypothetical protein
MKTIRTLLSVLLALVVTSLTASAHPGHGDGTLFRDSSPAHLFLHPWQLATLVVAGFAVAALARARWARWAGGALALTAATLLLVGAV